MPKGGRPTPDIGPARVARLVSVAAFSAIPSMVEGPRRACELHAARRHLTSEHLLQCRGGLGEPAGVREARCVEHAGRQGTFHVHGFLCWERVSVATTCAPSGDQ